MKPFHVSSRKFYVLSLLIGALAMLRDDVPKAQSRGGKITSVPISGTNTNET